MKLLESQTYSFSAKMFWRFVFIYLVLYVYPYGFEYIYKLTTDDISFWSGITTWFGETFLGWEFNKDRLMNGFDSKYDYSRFLLITVISLIGTLFWLFIDSKIKRLYTGKLKILIQTLLRYHVGFTLIVYGLSKVLLLQFGVIDINALETKIGDQSGMGFLWAFMGYSKFYGITAGLVEVIGGILLLYRRTTFIGAFILFIAMANVVLMDIGYDVRVKMFAIHLFLMTVLLMSDHLKQLVRFFITNKPTVPYSFQPFFNTLKSKKMGYAIKSLILIYFTITSINSFKDRISEEKVASKHPELTSMHEINLFVKNDDTISNTSKYDERWKSMMINGYRYFPDVITVKLNNGQKEWFSFEADTIAKIIDFKPYDDTTNLKYPFHYKKINNQAYQFEGVYKGDSLRFSTKAKTLKDYNLTSKGMHWITDLE